jgi:hypothetical protein
MRRVGLGGVGPVAVERAVDLLELLEQGVLAPLKLLLALERVVHCGRDVGLPGCEVRLVFAVFHGAQATGDPCFTK